MTYLNLKISPILAFTIIVIFAVVVGMVTWAISNQPLPEPSGVLVAPKFVEDIDEITNPEFVAYLDSIRAANPRLGFAKKETRQIVYGEESTFPSPPSNKDDPMWVFSPDGQKAISVFGYLGEPDSSLDVYNRNNTGKSENLKMCGTPCNYWIVFWLDNDQFIFVQSHEYYPPSGELRCGGGEKCTKVIEVSHYDLEKNTETVYQSQELDMPVAPEGPEWWEKKKDLVLEEVYGPLWNWETYRNEEYGFEVKYPPDWDRGSADASSEESAYWLHQTDFSSISFSDPRSATITEFTIIIAPRDAYEEIPPASAKNRSMNEGSILVDDLPGTRFDYSQGQPITSEVWVTKGEEVWIIRGGISLNKEQLFYQILSTFKFIE